MLVLALLIFLAVFVTQIGPDAPFFLWRLNLPPILIVGSPIGLIILPTLGALGQGLFFKRSLSLSDYFVMVATFLTVIWVLLIYPVAITKGIFLSLPHVLGLGLSFHIDALSYALLLVTSILWFCVMVYAHEYMKIEHHPKRFFLFMGLTYAGVLGTLMAGDLWTMFLFFEGMTLASYVVVTHGQKKASFLAGYNYIFMGLLGGFAIFFAMALLYGMNPDLSFTSRTELFINQGFRPYLIIGLLLFGFGVKAGMAPVHVWLPRAHPVAPTPASALLSGVMIKVGAYGVLRVVTGYYFPALTDGDWSFAIIIGELLIWLGLITMAIGVFFALLQKNIKRMLAYHSVSQMGYIVMGIGVAAYLAENGAMGYSGSLYHIINHALFKSLLFMVAGSIYLYTKELDMYQLGGLWRKIPLTAFICLIAALGISGVPLFNGFISKTLLHHGIEEAYLYGKSYFLYAEWIFNIISIGTVCSFIKLFSYTFLGPLPERFKDLKGQYLSTHSAMLAIVVMILFIGVFPRLLLDNIIVPALNGEAFSQNFISTYIVSFQFFNGADIRIMLWILLGGFVLFYAGHRFHWFSLQLPKWFSLEAIIFFPANVFFKWACHFLYGDECGQKQKELKAMALKDNHEVGFIDRLVYTVIAFNHRYEGSFIKMDVMIYSLALLGLFIWLLIFITF
jgi:formate hydrogenlyase subunit 3/multisubunit Na+/H+ antiporter MnhD subunit